MPRTKRKNQQGDDQQPDEEAAAKKAEEENKKKKKPWKPWATSKAKQQLKKWFKDGTLLLDYSETIGPRKLWDIHCEKHQFFGGAGMKYDSTFTNRLRSVKNDHDKKDTRADQDLQSFNNFMANHPTPAVNSRGEPRWQGSEAERQLKEDIKNQYHVGKKPKDLWEDAERQSYKNYPLKVFRDHIYQEVRLRKWLAFTKAKLREKGHVFSDDEEGGAAADEDAIEVVDEDGFLLNAP